MSNGPGLTGDLNFQHSCEAFRIGSDERRIFYGKTRAELLDDRDLLSSFFDQPAVGYLPEGWEDELVVTETRSIRMGLGSAWVRATRRYDEHGERVYPASAKARRRGVQQRKGQDGRA